MIKKEIQTGQIVRSTNGRDEGQYYLVLSVNEKSANLVDGKAKKLSNPKKKNVAHLQATTVINTEIANKITNNLKVNDQMIYHSLYEYKKELKGCK